MTLVSDTTERQTIKRLILVARGTDQAIKAKCNEEWDVRLVSASWFDPGMDYAATYCRGPNCRVDPRPKKDKPLNLRGVKCYRKTFNRDGVRWPINLGVCGRCGHVTVISSTPPQEFTR